MKRPRFFGRPLKKVRGWKNKRRRSIKISDITSNGFRLRTFNRDYYINRDNIFTWFLGATNREIQTVVLMPCACSDPHNCTCRSDHPGDHIRWELLDLDFCTFDIAFPDHRRYYNPK